MCIDIHNFQNQQASSTSPEKVQGSAGRKRCKDHLKWEQFRKLKEEQKVDALAEYLPKFQSFVCFKLN